MEEKHLLDLVSATLSSGVPAGVSAVPERRRRHSVKCETRC
jgi:hypothetical protein